MRKVIINIVWLIALALIVFGQYIFTAPKAHADYFKYPCQPPGVGTGVDVNIIVDAQGQFCDGPMEINLTHLHCESGGVTANLGAIALAPIGGAALGGIGAGGIGGGGNGCSWRCPDNTLAPAPNPPFVWQHSFIDPRAVIKKGTAFCVVGGHLDAAGPTSEMADPNEGFPDDTGKPWEQGDPMINMPRRQQSPPQPKPEVAGPPPEGELPIPAVPPIPALPGLPALPLP